MKRATDLGAADPLGIEIRTASAERVFASISSPWSTGSDLEIACLMLAHAAARTGCRQALAGAAEIRITSSNFLMLEHLDDEQPLSAEARPVRSTPAGAIWRAKVFAGRNAAPGSRAIAELTLSASAAVEGSTSEKSAPAAPVEATVVELTPRRRADSYEEKLDQVMAGAYEVISRKGYGSATMREIAQASGMPLSSMYQYFQHKEDLLYLMTDRYLSQLSSEFETALSRSNSATEMLIDATQKYIAYCGTHRKLINLTYREAKSLSREKREKIFELDRRFVTIWEKILATGVKNGEFEIDNVELYANYIYFLCTAWAIRHWNLGRFKEEVIVESLRAFILRAVRP
jgi:AcrR family transcriptional regulator